MAKDSSICLPPQFIENLDDLPLPALDLIPLQKLWSSGPRWIIMVATRGCVYNCVFCSIHTIMGRRIRRRSIDNIILELQHWKQLYKIQEVYFEDDNLTANKKWAKELFRQIAKCNLGIRFYARNGIRADTVDREMLLLMKAAGFQDFMIAPESGSQRTLDEVIGKKMKLEDCTRVVKLAREVNLGVNAFFVIGFPEETWADIEATLDYARHLKALGCAGFWISLASPYPGTRLFKQCQERGLLPENFDYRRCRTVDYQVNNPHYSAIELKAYRRRAMAELSPLPLTLTNRLRNGLILLIQDPSYFLVKLRYKLGIAL
jgi:magnesium-protoporphyrin IX monomethyl ester (oxidative) cyclase